MPRSELTLIANVALDRVNHGPWTCGGCPTFAPYSFARLEAAGVINTACAQEDVPRFRALPTVDQVSFRIRPAATTTRFDLDYSGQFSESRTMVLHTIGHEWSAADIDALEIDTEWVHLAPLLRSDFPVATVERLAAHGHRIAYDGQGLVRVPRVGELTFDAAYDPELLRHLTVLKLSEDEAAVLAAEQGHDRLIESLSGVPELLLTLGPRGVEICSGGGRTQVAPGQVITDVQTTGAGDSFMIAYLVGRHRGRSPAAAAELAANLTAEMLAERKREG